MSFLIDIAFEGNLEEVMQADLRAGERAVTNVTKRKARQVKNRLRRQIKRAGLGERLGNTVRDIVQPKRGASLNAAGLVFSKAVTRQRAGGFTDLLTVFAEGTTIRPKRARFLAIPVGVGRTTSVRGSRGQQSRRGAARAEQPSDFPPGTFFFRRLPSGNGGLFFAAPPHGLAFVLVRQVRIRRRLDVEAALSGAVANMDQQIARDWERRSQRAFDRIRNKPRR